MACLLCVSGLTCTNHRSGKLAVWNCCCTSSVVWQHSSSRTIPASRMYRHALDFLCRSQGPGVPVTIHRGPSWRLDALVCDIRSTVVSPVVLSAVNNCNARITCFCHDCHLGGTKTEFPYTGRGCIKRCFQGVCETEKTCQGCGRLRGTRTHTYTAHASAHNVLTAAPQAALSSRAYPHTPAGASAKCLQINPVPHLPPAAPSHNRTSTIRIM